MVQKDRRIKNYHRPNGGVVAAREFAVTKAMGKYLFFLDSDDYLPMMHWKYYFAQWKQLMRICVLVAIHLYGRKQGKMFL